MLRAALWTLRQRRYAALAVCMALLALICVGAGTFELHRYHEKRDDNAAIKANARAAAVPLRASLVPLVGRGPAPDAQSIRYRTVRATGTYLTGAQRYVDDQSQGGRQGFYVLTPLRTADGLLLVVRGFVAATADGSRPADVPAPPKGIVRVTGRLQTAEATSDHQGRLGHGEITSINPVEQAERLGAPTYQAYLALPAGQPGSAGLRPVPGPALGNPTGGASEWQLLSYVVQWYVFALLALATPFLFSRAEMREARRRFLGIDPAAVQFDLAYSTALQLGAASAFDSEDGGRVLAVRDGATPARRYGPGTAQRRRAERLADRYALSLGIGREGMPERADASGPDDAAAPPGIRRTAVAPGLPRGSAVPRSSVTPHRSGDAYHGGYNDYLWQLALADGEVPDVFGPRDPAAGETGPGVIEDGAVPPVDPAPRETPS